MTNDKTTVKAAIRILIDYVNGYSSDDLGEMIFDELTHTHRTLQQSLIGAIKIALEKYAELPETWTDARNEYAWKWAKGVKASTEFPGRLPLI